MQTEVLNELEQKFKEANETDDFAVMLNFGKQLTASNEPEILEYHFNLFKRVNDNRNLHGILISSFERRREVGRTYLLNRISSERDAFLIATGLQTLGKMRCPEAIDVARGFITHQDALVREWSCIVIGWVGAAQDVELLGRIQLVDVDINTRKWAATQQMHIWLRFPDVKNAVLANLFSAIEKETEPDVIEMILYSTEKVMKRRFGLKGNPGSQDGRMQGDLQEAKRRATVALNNYLKVNAS